MLFFKHSDWLSTIFNQSDCNILCIGLGPGAAALPFTTVNRLVASLSIEPRIKRTLTRTHKRALNFGHHLSTAAGKRDEKSIRRSFLYKRTDRANINKELG